MASTQHQVFINFRGADVRENLINGLVLEMQAAGINVFVDTDQIRGQLLDDLLVEIQNSEVAVVIFSENYTNSEWCLRELVKIKECADDGTLMAIPVFYNLESDDVKLLEGNFGFHFRATKRRNVFDTINTRRWEDAIASISRRSGIVHNHMPNIVFNNSLILEVQRSLEHIAEIANQRGNLEAVQIQQPEQIQARQPEAVQIYQPEVNGQGIVFNVRQLKISGSHNARYWTFESISESPNGAAIEFAKMKICYYLEVSGKFHTRELTLGTRYEVVFVVKVEDTMSRWDNPVTAQLMIPNEDLQEREFQFVDVIRNEWIDIQAGVFIAQPLNEMIAFYLFQHQSDVRMTGLLVKGAIIRPME